MEHLIDVLAHTGHGYPLFLLAFVGGSCIACSFAFVSWIVARQLTSDEGEQKRAAYESIVLAFDPEVRGLYAFRAERRDGPVGVPGQRKESVH